MGALQAMGELCGRVWCLAPHRARTGACAAERVWRAREQPAGRATASRVGVQMQRGRRAMRYAHSIWGRTDRLQM